MEDQQSLSSNENFVTSSTSTLDQFDDLNRIDNNEEQLEETIIVDKIIPSKFFDLKFVCDSFQKSIKDRSQIDLDCYLKGYVELVKFFNVFGTLFTFVTKDVHSKIAILKCYLEDDSIGLNYITINSMIQYEKNENLLQDNKRPSGSRTLLRLHRALEFISLFLNEVTKLDDDQSTVQAARFAYQNTLARFHPWLIQKSVHIATIGLPYRKNLVEKVYGGEYPKDGAKIVNSNISYLATIIMQVFNVTQKLYEENNMLELP